MIAAVTKAAPRQTALVLTGESVLAVRRGQKTQTRRLAKESPQRGGLSIIARGRAAQLPGGAWSWTDPGGPGITSLPPIRCPYGDVGDQLWVKETYSTDLLGIYPFPAAWYKADYDPANDPACDIAADWHVSLDCPGRTNPKVTGGDCFTCAARRDGGFRWRSPRFMPRALSRQTLVITEVRLERLQAITEEDAKAEGVTPHVMRGIEDYPEWMRSRMTSRGGHHSAFEEAWDKLNRRRAPWSDNPWVWAITFRGSR